MPARKRSASEAESVATRRRSGRISNSVHKSAYFEDSNDDVEEAELPLKKKRGRPAKKLAAKEESGGEKYEEEPEEDVLPKKKKKRGRPAKKQVQAKEDSDVYEYKDESEQKEDDDDDDDDDGVRKVEILPLEKLRDTGGVEYEDHKVHRNTMLFLGDLKANNNRPWLKAHDGEYRRALKDWQSFVETTTQELIEVDDTIPELPAKDVIFRIHRDIRFSKDPTPYKPHFSAAWSRTGRKGPYAVYYIHCEPGSNFIGGGLWHPEAQYVQKLRQSIDERPRRWRRAFSDPLFKRIFFPDVKAGAGPEEMIKAFVGKNQENALKKKPMGYEVTHRDIELLKLRNYTVGAKIDDDVLCSDDAQEKIGEIMRGLSGFVTFLNSIVMPDPNFDDEDDSDEEEGEENGDEEEDEEE